MIDTLLRNRDKAEASGIMKEMGLSAGKYAFRLRVADGGWSEIPINNPKYKSTRRRPDVYLIQMAR